MCNGFYLPILIQHIHGAVARWQMRPRAVSWSAMGDFSAVVTSIQAPTASMAALAKALRRHQAPLLVVGDEKGPTDFDLPGAELISLQQQRVLPFRLATVLPTRHYARKNLGYLLAIQRGAPCIYETDDDNGPAETWHPPTLSADARTVRAGQSLWCNVYRLIDRAALIWPRGFPLDRVRDRATCDLALAPLSSAAAPIQQGLADLAPDVDAVWRLLLDRPYSFPPTPPIRLPAGCFCPFNSQNTWWFPPAYPLMYLPSYCSFRMTDIWRSFIAQRCLWEVGFELIFRRADVVQQRNEHNLMRDFNDEVVGYQRNDEMARLLTGLTLERGPAAVAANLRRCYSGLAGAGFFPDSELPLLDAWLADLAQLGR